MASFSVRASLCALFAALALVGCAGDDEGTAGTGGGAGVAGDDGGMGGAAGMMSGGMSGGGAGGMAGGGGGGGAGGMSGEEVPGCDAAMTGEPAELYAAAAEVLTTQGKCSFAGTCHDAPTRTAGLELLESTDIAALLVDQPACLTPAVPLVASGGGDDALQNSWLWLKLVAPADKSGVLQENAAWGTPGASCNQMTGQPYGVRMPWGTTTGYASEQRLAAIRNWICAGAPGP